MYQSYCFQARQAPFTQEEQDMSMPHKPKYGPPTSENDTEEIAAFLCALKHRSVTPEPSLGSAAPPAHTQHFSHPSPLRSNEMYVDKTPALLLQEEQQQQQQQLEQSLLMNAEDIDVESLLGDSPLVMAGDRDLVPDALFVAMAQMRPCTLTQADRVGCYKSRELGFVGMACMHCGGQPGFGRYYPNSVRSLAQTTTSQTILKHVGNKCRFVPNHIRHAVNELQRLQAAREGMSTGRPRYGSRKVFFQRVWSRLHGGPMPHEDDPSVSTSSPVSESRGSSCQSSPSTSDDEDASSESSVPRSGKRAKNQRKGAILPTQKNLKRALVSDGNATKRPRVLSH